MEATLKIYGDIGESVPDIFNEDGQGNISARMVSEFLDKNKDATSITVKINSRGGDVQEGWAIYDLLTSSGKRVKTIGEGKIYSIATIVFLAGSEREMLKNADGLIHNPYIPPFTLADSYESGDLIKIAESLQQEETKILNFYAERTGAPADKLAEYMKEDTKLSAEDMLSLGFATRIIEPVKAYAYINNNKFKKTMDEKAFFERLGSTLDSAVQKIAGFSRLTSRSQVITDKEGKELNLEKDSGVPAVGDKASPDGTYTMESGTVITVSGGSVTDIQTKEADETELDKANAKIAELEAKVADMESQKISAEASEKALKDETEKAVALVTELTNLKNTWKPDARSKGADPVKTVGVNLDRVREIKEKLNK
jgi:ATP-dependent Clp protease protease subunit